MNCYQITLENFTGKVNPCLAPAIYPCGSKGRNPPKVGEGETIPTYERSACVPKSFHQAGGKVVASFSQTVAFCQVICKRSQEPESCP